MIPSLRTACSVAGESAKLRNLPPRRIPEQEYREITENAVIIEVQRCYLRLPSPSLKVLVLEASLSRPHRFTVRFRLFRTVRPACSRFSL